MALSSSAVLADKATLQQLTNHLPTLVSVLLVVAIAYTLAQLTWQFYPQDEADVAVVDTRRNPVTPVSRGNRVRDITTSYLFGRVQAGKPVVNTTRAPVSRLNLTLRGVLAANPDSLASAIISKGKGGKEDIYGVGDSIQRGVKLSEIHNDYVIIESQGKREKLVLTKETANNGRQPLLRTTQTSSSNPTTLKEVRKQIMKNPVSFGDYAVPIVYKENGKQIGYRLRPQAKGELLTQYGIQPDDVITKINGVKLDNPQSGIKALRELSSATEVNLTIKRGGSYVPLNIQLQ